MNLDLSKIKHPHFIGIGGIGISAIARMMLEEGKEVSGQDTSDSEVISELRKKGAKITIGQSLENIPPETNLIVYTIAIITHAPEMYAALAEQEIPFYSYPEMLGIVSEDKYTIAIAGTHGKTTTTAMIAQIFREAEKDPTVIVGSLLIGEKSNFIAGKSKYFIVEACEYRRSFLNINPKALVITNIDEDHLDYYKDIEDIKSAFRELVMKVPEDGFVICNPHDPNIADVIKNAKAKIVDYSVYIHDTMQLKVPGVHNRKNAGAAEAVAVSLGLDTEKSEASLQNFPGTWRRFEYKGKLASGALVYDDYAHHPQEIKATLQGFRELYPAGEGWALTVVFQPHLYSRTKALLEEFAQSFDDADGVLLLPIYAAREDDDDSISSEILAGKINGPHTEVFTTFDQATRYITSINLHAKDVIVTMGAGEAFKIGDELLR